MPAATPPSPDRLTLTRPDDWHLHLRDGAALAAVVGATARVFGRAIIMPNLKPPVASVAQAAAYRERILAALSAASPARTRRTCPRDCRAPAGSNR